MRYRALDFTFSLSGPRRFVEATATALEPLADPEQLPEASIVVSFADDRWTIDGPDARSSARTIGEALARTLEMINRHAAASVVDSVPLHAAAVRASDGSVVVLAGRSGSGKSTLSAAAIDAGWGFLAEEIAAVSTDTLAVRPFHRPIGLRAGGAEALGRVIPDDPDGLFSQVYPWPVPRSRRVSTGELIAIALVDRAGDPGITELSTPRALAELVEHTVVPHDDRVVPVFRSLDHLVRRVPVFRLGYQQLGPAVDMLGDLAVGRR